MAKKQLTTAQMQAALEKFLGESKVKQRLYHGTNKSFKSFTGKNRGTNDHGWYGQGHYFTADPHTASAYSAYDLPRSQIAEGSNVLPVHVQAKNPYYWPAHRDAAKNKEESVALTKELQSLGHDSVVVKNKYQDPEYADHHEVVLFNPKAIKSAIGNRGTYDPTNPDITKAKGGVVNMAKGGQAALDAMRLELLNNEPLDIVGNTKRNLQGAWDVAKNVPGNLKRMAADPVAYAKSLPSPTGEQMMNMLQPGHVGGFAGVIKPKGGNWYKAPYAGPTVEGSIERMKPYQNQEPRIAHHKAAMSEALGENNNRIASQHENILNEATKRHALNQWVENNLQNYIKKQMGTPEDPIRALHEEGISHLPKDTREGALETDRDTQMRRTEAGYPAEGMAKSDLAKTWENLSDENIWSKPAGEIQRAPQAFKELAEVDKAMRDRQDMVTIKFRNMINKNDALSQAEKETMLRNTPSSEQSKMVGDTELQGLILKRNKLNNLADRENLAINEMNPWAAKLPPETPLHQGMTSGLGFDHVIDILKQDVEAGRIRPEQLNKISVSDAVRRTHEFDQEAARKMAEAQIKSTEGMPVHKEYPEGYKWIELAPSKELPEGWTKQNGAYYSPEGLRQVHPDSERLGAALKYEGDTMGHCVGGYCPDVLEGTSRIYSLRSPKGEPHVTIETGPAQNYERQAAAMKKAGSSDEEVAAFFANPPQRIVQIKGKQNAAPHAQYQPYVQDFVKSGQWSDVGDLRNTGLVRHPETGQYLTPAEMQPMPPEGRKNGGIIYKAEGGNVQPNMAQMRFALNQSQLTNIGANEAPNMSPKVYLSPAQNQDDYPAPDGSATQNGVPIGGVDQDPQQPGQQLVAPPLEPQPPQPGQPQPPAGQQPGMQPGQQPPNVPGIQGQPFANPSPQGMLTAPQGPTPPKGNMLAMTPQGQTMQALGGGQPKPPGMAKGGTVQPTGNAMMDELLRRHYAGERLSKMENELLGLYHRVGGGRKLAKPIDQYQFDVENNPRVNMAPEKIITPEDLQGGYGMPFIGDSAMAGRLLTGAEGKKFQQPVELEGGHDYMRANQHEDPSKRAIWASAQGKISHLTKKAKRVSKNGEPVYGIHASMSPTGVDFSHMPVEVLAELVKNSKISKKAEAAFNKEMKAKHKDFPGVMHPELHEMLRAPKAGELRKHFVERMATEPHQKAGFPEMAMARLAVQHPNLMRHDAPGKSFVGSSIGKFRPDFGQVDKPVNPHHSYPSVIGGEYVGALHGEKDQPLMTTEDFFPEFHKERRKFAAPEAGDRRAFELSQPIQKFDQEWVDKVMPAYLARRKALVGKKTGGGVKLAPTQDTMRLALTKKKAK